MAQHATATVRNPEAAATSVRGPRPGARGRRVLDPKDNSLNLVRLVLALAVLVSHLFPLSGLGEDPHWAGESLGGWAVIGFFALSGYLITGSRLRSDGGRYLISRVARIFPGYLVSLLVVALVFAPVAFVVQHGTIDGFLTTPTTPLTYVHDNALLRVEHWSVAGTLAESPYPGAWNGSVWSLYFEFLCYIVVGVAAVVPVVRRRAWPIIAMFAVSVVVHAQMPRVSAYLGGGDFALLMKLLPYFLGGAVLFVLKERTSLRWHWALLALVVALGTVLWQPVWGGQLAAPLFTYVLLWVGAALPAPRVLQVHDLSYGMYVYAFPVTQLLVLLGVHEHGLVLLGLAVTGLTSVLAAASWFLVERPSRDALARVRVGARADAPAGTGRPAQPVPVPSPARVPVPVPVHTVAAAPRLPLPRPETAPTTAPLRSVARAER